MVLRVRTFTALVASIAPVSHTNDNLCDITVTASGQNRADRIVRYLILRARRPFGTSFFFAFGQELENGQTQTHETVLCCCCVN